MLVIAGTNVPTTLITKPDTVVTSQLGPEAAAILDSTAVPVWLRIETPDGPLETSRVYPYHLAALANMLLGRRDPDLLRKTGSLDLEVNDDELTALLEELDAALVIDGESLWRLSGRTVAGGSSSSDGARLRWEDLDFDALRRHPRLSQYQSATGRQTDHPGATDLQIVLAAITEHFRRYGRGSISPGTNLSSLRALRGLTSTWTIRSGGYPAILTTRPRRNTGGDRGP